jgi:hypothetical protein
LPLGEKKMNKTYKIQLESYDPFTGIVNTLTLDNEYDDYNKAQQVATKLQTSNIWEGSTKLLDVSVIEIGDK